MIILPWRVKKDSLTRWIFWKAYQIIDFYIIDFYLFKAHKGSLYENQGGKMVYSMIDILLPFF